MEKRVFRTRYSIILVAVMAVTFGALLMAVLLEPGWVTAIACLSSLGLTGLFAGFTYVIDGDRLIMKNWRWKIGEVSIHSIEKVKRSYLALSSNAWSLKRLEIRLQKGSKYPFLLILPGQGKRVSGHADKGE